MVRNTHFVNYLLNIAGGAPDLALSPLYLVDGTCDLDERALEDWPGFNNDGPVRVGNGAIRHAQNDIFGEMVLALAPVFLDERFSAERSSASLDLLQRLTRKAIAVAGSPDAGIWEYRTEWKPQTFSTLMCWAAADRMASVVARQAPDVEGEFRQAAARIRDEIITRCWNAGLDSFVGTNDGQDLDASLLQLADLHFLPAGDPRLLGTINAVRGGLSQQGWLLRYRVDDGFGPPQVAFTLCTFWLVQALVATGRREEAREIMERAHSALSPLGLLSEDYRTADLRMWGNFPQAYSHTGLIHAAFAASPRWGDIL